jgi:hypothetical protein
MSPQHSGVVLILLVVSLFASKRDFLAVWTMSGFCAG